MQAIESAQLINQEVAQAGKGVMSDSDRLSVTPSDVLYSADYLDVLGHQAGAERRALSVELSGNTTAWRDGAAAGFNGFIHIVSQQAERIARDVDDVATKLRAAAHAYAENEQRSAERLRYRPTDM